MRYLIGTAVASAVLVAPAWAGTTAAYTMTGTAPGVCTVQGSGTITFSPLIDSTTGATNVVSGTTFSTTDSTAFCNQANTTISISHSNLSFSAGSVPGGFTNIFPITAVKITSPQLPSGVTETGTPNGTAMTTPAGGTIKAFNTLTITATAGAPSGSLMANASGYSGTISISLTPTS